MNRIDRLFNILLLLQQKRSLRAKDLADQFELSERTIYRDIAALMQMGVPIVGAAGEGYQLMEGFHLPPLMFTQEEASFLMLAVSMLASTKSFPDHAQKALNKIFAILPQSSRFRVMQQTEWIQFHPPPMGINWEDDILKTLQQAIGQRRVVRIHYYSRQDEATQRDIEPSYLTYNNGVWYITAYCRLRQDERVFRLDRIKALHLKEEHFSVVDGLFADPPPPSDRHEKIKVLVRYSLEAKPWVDENQHYAYVDRQGLVYEYQVDHLQEIQNWLLGWGAKAEVLAPEVLRQAIIAEAEALLAQLKGS